MTGEIQGQSTGELDTQAAPRQRVRLVYAKGEAIKFISHQDEFRLWERTLRRADLPLLYKQGFNPQPHMQFASPLGVGFTGSAELLDITLSPPVPLDELQQRIAAKLPPGVTLHSAVEVPLKADAPQSLLLGADYTILIYTAPDELAQAEVEQRMADFLAQTTVWRERERKGERYQYNLRPLVFELTYRGYAADQEEHRIFLRVQQRAGATGRPDEVVAALGLDHHARTLRRDRLYFADRPDDIAVFAAYPVITQESIAGPRPAPRPTRGSHPDAAPHPQPHGRSISERAGDEFA
jgi:radical SAM-linked protein